MVAPPACGALVKSGAADSAKRFASFKVDTRENIWSRIHFESARMGNADNRDTDGTGKVDRESTDPAGQLKPSVLAQEEAAAR